MNDTIKIRSSNLPEWIVALVILCLMGITISSLTGIHSALKDVIGNYSSAAPITMANKGVLLGIPVLGSVMVAPFVSLYCTRWPTKIHVLLITGLMGSIVSNMVIAGYHTDYYIVLFMKILIGVVSGTFNSLATPIVEQKAPVSMKSICVTIPLLTRFAAQSGGYIIAAQFPTPEHWGEAQYIFIGLSLSSLALAPLLCLFPNCFSITDKSISTAEDGAKSIGNTGRRGSSRSVRTSIWRLVNNVGYVATVVAISASVFSMAAMFFWAPQFMVEMHDIDKDDANKRAGINTAAASILGTLFGGVVLHYTKKMWNTRIEKGLASTPNARICSHKAGNRFFESSTADESGGSFSYYRCAKSRPHFFPFNSVIDMRNQMFFVSVFVATGFAVLALVFCCGCVCLVTANAVLFEWLFGLAQASCYSMGPALVDALINSVHPELKLQAVAYACLCYNLIGSFSAPPLVGAIADTYGSNGGFMFLTIWVFIFSGSIIVSFWVAKRRAFAEIADDV